MKRLIVLGMGLLMAMLVANIGSETPVATAQGGIAATPSAGIYVPPPPKPPFFIRSYGGKCLDFGAPPQVVGGPVFIYGCNNTIAQQVRIEEVDAQHNVILRAGDKV